MTVQRPVRKQPPNGMSHRGGGGLAPPPTHPQKSAPFPLTGLPNTNPGTSTVSTEEGGGGRRGGGRLKGWAEFSFRGGGGRPGTQKSKNLGTKNSRINISFCKIHFSHNDTRVGGEGVLAPPPPPRRR